MNESVKAVLVLIGLFTASFVLASFLTTIINKALNKFTAISIHKPSSSTYNSKSSFYYPNIIQQIRNLFNLQSNKAIIQNSKIVQSLKCCCNKKTKNNAIGVFNNPFSESDKHPAQKSPSHQKPVYKDKNSESTKCKQNHFYLSSNFAIIHLANTVFPFPDRSLVIKSCIEKS